jgi:hypothetical protein
MKIYLDLLEGNRQSLQAVLREHFGHSTLNRVYQPYMTARPNTTPSSASATTPTTGNLETPPPSQVASNALQQFLSQQQQQLPQQQLLQSLQTSSPNNLLQQHTQLLQLAQQQQYYNQLNAAAAAAALNNPSSTFNLQSFNLGAQLTTPPPGAHLNLAQQASYQNALNNLNFSSTAVNQLFQQQAQQQQQGQIGSNTTSSFLSALQSRIS